MGKFTVRETNGKFNFRLKADNGEVIAVSQQYKSLDTCKAGIESVRVNAAAASLPIWDFSGEEVRSWGNSQMQEHWWETPAQ